MICLLIKKSYCLIIYILFTIDEREKQCTIACNLLQQCRTWVLLDCVSIVGIKDQTQKNTDVGKSGSNISFANNGLTAIHQVIQSL